MLTETRPRPLTERQEALYRFIYEFTCRNGFQPSLREIGEHFSFNTSAGVCPHLKALQSKGWIKTEYQRSKAIRFVFTPDGRPWRGFTEVAEEVADPGIIPETEFAG